MVESTEVEARGIGVEVQAEEHNQIVEED